MEENISPVKEIREKIGVSQRALADAFGVHHTLISNLEMNLIDISGDDEEMYKKAEHVFSKLAEYTGIPKETLINKQKECTKNQEISTKARVEEQISISVESMTGLKKLTSADEFKEFFNTIYNACVIEQENIVFDGDVFADNITEHLFKSPVKIFRERGGITQREIAQAIGVSQTLIARIELGEMPLSGVIGKKFTNLVYESLGGLEYNEQQNESFANLHGEPYDGGKFGFNELYEVLSDCQGMYSHYVMNENEKKVKDAFRALKKKEGSDKGSGAEKKNSPLGNKSIFD